MELLVVVTIIGLLVGLISVAVPKAIESGMKAKTKGELTSIVAAVKAYKQEYGQWPVAKSKMDSVADEYNSWYGPPTQEQESKDLMKILSGDMTVQKEGQTMNPKGVRFLEGAKTDGTFQDPLGKAVLREDGYERLGWVGVLRFFKHPGKYPGHSDRSQPG